MSYLNSGETNKDDTESIQWILTKSFPSITWGKVVYLDLWKQN